MAKGGVGGVCRCKAVFRGDSSMELLKETYTGLTSCLASNV